MTKTKDNKWRLQHRVTGGPATMYIDGVCITIPDDQYYEEWIKVIDKEE